MRIRIRNTALTIRIAKGLCSTVSSVATQNKIIYIWIQHFVKHGSWSFIDFNNFLVVVFSKSLQTYRTVQISCPRSYWLYGHNVRTDTENWQIWTAFDWLNKEHSGKKVFGRAFIVPVPLNTGWMSFRRILSGMRSGAKCGQSAKWDIYIYKYVIIMRAPLRKILALWRRIIKMKNQCAVHCLAQRDSSSCSPLI